MDPDRLIHEKKNFAELEDRDVEIFLKERKFHTEHQCIEFKSGFPLRNNNKFRYKEICEYIIGFLNSEGGLLIYGVDDTIRDVRVSFPDYVCGVAVYPSLEDLSEWGNNFIYPITPSPSIRFFKVAGKDIVIIKVPSGVNKPYCLVNPETKEISISLRTSGILSRLGPDQIREFFRNAIVEQSERIIATTKEAELITNEETSVKLTKVMERISKRQDVTRAKLEDTINFGYVGIYCYPDESISISFNELEDFMKKHRFEFSESMRYAPRLEILQDGISVGFYPTSIRKDIKSTARTTLYTDGHIAFDSQADDLMDKIKEIFPTWLSYEILRHLQLTKAILEKKAIKEINVYINFDNISDFSLAYTDRLVREKRSSKYQGHEPIRRKVALEEINSFDGDHRNIAFQSVQNIMDEISRIFGFSKTPQICWDKNGYLEYVKGLEGTR